MALFLRYGILCEAVDRMVEQCQSIRTVLGIPDVQAEELPDETSKAPGREGVDDLFTFFAPVTLSVCIVYY